MCYPCEEQFCREVPSGPRNSEDYEGVGVSLSMLPLFRASVLRQHEADLEQKKGYSERIKQALNIERVRDE